MSTTLEQGDFAELFVGARADGRRWQPVPPVQDRAAWNLPAGTVNAVVEAAHEAVAAGEQARPWLTPWAWYGTTGVRTRWEKEQGAVLRATALSALALAATGDQEWLDPLADNVWRLCEMTSWCLPSHYALPEDGARPILPIPGRHVLDLSAGYTGGTLAVVDRIAGDLLEGRFPGLRARVHHEIEQRVLRPWHGEVYFWHGVGTHPNNWAPWIVSNVLACAAVVETDLRATVDRAVPILDRFRTGYGDDGSCDEGATYFWWAAATLVEALDVLEAVTGVDGFDVAPVPAMARFPMLMQLSQQWQIAFGDAGAVVPDNASWHLLARFGARVEDEEVVQHARWMGSAHPLDLRRQHAATFLRTLVELHDIGWTDGPAVSGLPRAWFGSSTETMVAREGAGSTQGFVVAAKGGHNDVSHNHDDVGGVIVHLDGEPVLIDVGVGTYRRETFQAETRYDIWTMRSAFHNVPLPDGVEQSPGLEFRADGTRFEDQAATTSLTMDLAAAYPAQAGLDRCVRTVTLDRGERCVTVVDDWGFDRPRQLTLVFMTVVEPLPGDGFLEVGPARLSYDAERFEVEVEAIATADPKLEKVWGPTVHRTRLVERVASGAGRHRFSISHS